MSDGQDAGARPARRPLGDRATFLLSKLGLTVAEEFAARLAPLGVQPPHFAVLDQLDVAEGRTQQQLADALGVHRNVMVGLVDELEERGLAERRRHPADRRAHAVHLTARARDVLAEVERIADAQEADLLAGLGAADRTALIALLRRLAADTPFPPGTHSGLRHRARPRS